MADQTTIEWTDATWNPVTGCSVVSAGCTNCYAMRLSGTRLRHHPSRAGLTNDSKAGPVWNGEVRLNEGWLTQPFLWTRPRRIFVCAHGDLFHEGVPDAWIDRVFAVMALCPQHTFQVLTKRSARMRAYLSSDETAGRLTRALAHGIEGLGTLKVKSSDDGLRGFMLPNVWLGVSIEDQRRADDRVPDLLATPAAVRFVSAEPLLGPIDFTSMKPTGLLPGAAHISTDPYDKHELDALAGRVTPVFAPHHGGADVARLDWIIVGGESGPAARPTHPAWARSIRDQCAAAGVAFHFKQHGAWIETGPQPGGDLGGDMRADRVRIVKRVGENDGHFRKGDVMMRNVGKKAAGRLLDGVTHDALPSAPPTPEEHHPDAEKRGEA